MKRRTLWMLGVAAVCSAAVGAMAAQSSSATEKAVNAAYGKYKGLKEGKNADYIPALAKVSPSLFGIAVVTVDGKVYTATTSAPRCRSSRSRRPSSWPA